MTTFVQEGEYTYRLENCDKVLTDQIPVAGDLKYGPSGEVYSYSGEDWVQVQDPPQRVSLPPSGAKYSRHTAIR